MQTETFQVKNIKCGGCVTTVRNGLAALPGVEQVDVQIEGGKVTVSGGGLERSQIAATLKSLGYPEA